MFLPLFDLSPILASHNKTAYGAPQAEQIAYRGYHKLYSFFIDWEAIKVSTA
jgi:hypothetical protein